MASGGAVSVITTPKKPPQKFHIAQKRELTRI